MRGGTRQVENGYTARSPLAAPGKSPTRSAANWSQSTTSGSRSGSSTRRKPRLRILAADSPVMRATSRVNSLWFITYPSTRQLMKALSGRAMHPEENSNAGDKGICLLKNETGSQWSFSHCCSATRACLRISQGPSSGPPTGKRPASQQARIGRAAILAGLSSEYPWTTCQLVSRQARQRRSFLR
jgi:hypothetical protein